MLLPSEEGREGKELLLPFGLPSKGYKIKDFVPLRLVLLKQAALLLRRDEARVGLLKLP